MSKYYDLAYLDDLFSMTGDLAGNETSLQAFFESHGPWP